MKHYETPTTELLNLDVEETILNMSSTNPDSFGNGGSSFDDLANQIQSILK